MLHIEPEGVATIQVFVARAFDATGSVSAGTTADLRSVVSVRASAEGDVIHTTLDFFKRSAGWHEHRGVLPGTSHTGLLGKRRPSSDRCAENES